METATITSTKPTTTHTTTARVVAALLVALTLVVGLGMKPASAQSIAYVDAFNNPVEAGGYVDVYGGGFLPGEFVDIDFGGWTIASVVADQNGDFWATGWVDSLMPEGAHPLDAYGDLGSWASMDLTVTLPSAPQQSQLFPYVGTFQLTVEPGGAVDILGGDFQPYEIVTIEFGGMVLDVVTADENGEFISFTWIDPLMPDGFHPLDAYGDLGSYAWTDLEVLSASAPVLAPTLVSWGPAPQGTFAIVDGYDFQPFEIVWFEFAGLSEAFTADENGFVSALVWIPLDTPLGFHPVDAYGDLGSYAWTDQGVDPEDPYIPHEANETGSTGSSQPNEGGTVIIERVEIVERPQESGEDGEEGPTPRPIEDETEERTSDDEETDDEEAEETEVTESEETETEEAEATETDDTEETDEEVAQTKVTVGSSDDNGMAMVLVIVAAITLAVGTAAGGYAVAKRRS